MVQDSGLGIGEAQLARLFEPFHRGPHERSAIEGTGIGLALTKALVIRMGGRIEVRSELDVGSEFCVSLPLRVG